MHQYTPMHRHPPPPPPGLPPAANRSIDEDPSVVGASSMTSSWVESEATAMRDWRQKGSEESEDAEVLSVAGCSDVPSDEGGPGALPPIRRPLSTTLRNAPSLSASGGGQPPSQLQQHDPKKHPIGNVFSPPKLPQSAPEGDEADLALAERSGGGITRQARQTEKPFDEQSDVSSPNSSYAQTRPSVDGALSFRDVLKRRKNSTKQRRGQQQHCSVADHQVMLTAATPEPRDNERVKFGGLKQTVCMSESRGRHEEQQQQLLREDYSSVKESLEENTSQEKKASKEENQQRLNKVRSMAASKYGSIIEMRMGEKAVADSKSMPFPDEPDDLNNEEDDHFDSDSSSLPSSPPERRLSSFSSMKDSSPTHSVPEDEEGGIDHENQRMRERRQLNQQRQQKLLLKNRTSSSDTRTYLADKRDIAERVSEKKEQTLHSFSPRSSPQESFLSSLSSMDGIDHENQNMLERKQHNQQRQIKLLLNRSASSASSIDTADTRDIAERISEKKAKILLLIEAKKGGGVKTPSATNEVVRRGDQDRSKRVLARKEQMMRALQDKVKRRISGARKGQQDEVKAKPESCSPTSSVSSTESSDEEDASRPSFTKQEASTSTPSSSNFGVGKEGEFTREAEGQIHRAVISSLHDDMIGHIISDFRQNGHGDVGSTSDGSASAVTEESNGERVKAQHTKEHDGMTVATASASLNSASSIGDHEDLAEDESDEFGNVSAETATHDEMMQDIMMGFDGVEEQKNLDRKSRCDPEDVSAASTSDGDDSDDPEDVSAASTSDGGGSDDPEAVSSQSFSVTSSPSLHDENYTSEQTIFSFGNSSDGEGTQRTGYPHGELGASSVHESSSFHEEERGKSEATSAATVSIMSSSIASPLGTDDENEGEDNQSHDLSLGSGNEEATLHEKMPQQSLSVFNELQRQITPDYDQPLDKNLDPVVKTQQHREETSFLQSASNDSGIQNLGDCGKSPQPMAEPTNAKQPLTLHSQDEEMGQLAKMHGEGGESDSEGMESQKSLADIGNKAEVESSSSEAEPEQNGACTTPSEKDVVFHPAINTQGLTLAASLPSASPSSSQQSPASGGSQGIGRLRHRYSSEERLSCSPSPASSPEDKTEMKKIATLRHRYNSEDRLLEDNDSSTIEDPPEPRRRHRGPKKSFSPKSSPVRLSLSQDDQQRHSTRACLADLEDEDESDDGDDEYDHDDDDEQIPADQMDVCVLSDFSKSGQLRVRKGRIFANFEFFDDKVDGATPSNRPHEQNLPPLFSPAEENESIGMDSKDGVLASRLVTPDKEDYCDNSNNDFEDEVEDLGGHHGRDGGETEIGTDITHGDRGDLATLKRVLATGIRSLPKLSFNDYSHAVPASCNGRRYGDV